MPDQHSSTVGGSSAERVINCPGSVALCRTVPRSPSSPAAMRGTALHEAFANLVLEDAADRVCEDYIGFKYQGYELTDDDVNDALVPALAAFDRYAKSRGGFEFACEVTARFQSIHDAWGTADLVGKHADGTSAVIDAKFGYVPVSPIENDQCMFYAAAARETEGLADLMDGKLIEVGILQPAASAEVVTWLTTQSRLNVYRVTLMAAVRAAGEAHAPVSLGNWCHWCEAKPVCPAWQEVVVGALDPAGAPEKLTAKQLGENLERIAGLRAWINAVQALAVQQLEFGHEVPGWKLVAGKNGARKYIEGLSDGDIIKLARRGGLLKVEAQVSKPLSPAQMEKAMKKKGSKRTFDAVFGKVVHSESTGTSLAPSDDKRPAVGGFAGLAALRAYS